MGTTSPQNQVPACIHGGDVAVIQAGRHHKALFAHVLSTRYYCDYINTIISILSYESKRNGGLVQRREGGIWTPGAQCELKNISVTGT